MVWISEQSRKNEYRPWIAKLFLLDYILVVSDAKMISEILANSEQFPRSQLVDRHNVLFGGKVLFAIRGEVWKLHRKILNPFFTTAKQRTIFTITKNLIIRATAILDRYCAANDTIDLHSLLIALTCDAICTFIFGKDFGCMEGDKHGIQKFYRMVLQQASLVYKIPCYLYLPLPQRRRFLAERTRIQTFLLSEIAKAPAHTLAGAVYRSGDLSPSELCVEILGLIFAGHDTTASSVAFCLGQHLPSAPEAIAAIRASAADLPTDLALWADSDVHGPAAEAAFKETLRLVPPAVTHPVQAAAGARVGGHLLRRGTQVFAHYHAAFRDPRYFGPDADAFRPSRWTDGTVDACARATGLPAARAFVPFLSISPHACPGRPIAETEAWLLLRAWTRRYTFVPQGPPPTEVLGVTICPSHMRVRIVRA